MINYIFKKYSKRHFVTKIYINKIKNNLNKSQKNTCKVFFFGIKLNRLIKIEKMCKIINNKEEF